MTYDSPAHVQKVLRRAAIAGVCAIQALGAQGAAQPIFSLGQPPVWLPYAAGGASFSGRGVSDAARAVVSAGVRRYVTNPVAGLLAVNGEAYAAVARTAEPGVRLMASTPAMGLSAGVDWRSRGGGFATILSFETAVRRGGLLGRGTMLRIDWLPRRREALSVGLSVPLRQPLAGRTRPRGTDASQWTTPRDARAATEATPVALPRKAEAALTRVGYAAANLLAYTNLFADDTGITRYGRSYTGAVRSYREELEQAFAAVAGDSSLGPELAARARGNLLDAVLLPYDGRFGQVKEGGIGRLMDAAQGRFTAWLNDSSHVPAAYRAGVRAVHERWLGIVEAIHANLLAQWRDSRLVWLPLQLALGEDQYDEQTEVDALIERAVAAAGHGATDGAKRRFTDRNALSYLRSGDLPLEIARSILATRDYHVLWTHDFTGRRDVSKTVDDVAYTMVADAYLPALTQAVASYDSTGRMPVYVVMLDAFYYHNRDGRLWMDILQDPLRARIRLPAGNAEREARLRARQEALRRAVASSSRLRREAAAFGGDEWLRRVVKVHVNVLLPSDFSFRSHRIIPGVPFVPDNVQRDHRKVVFYDINEADPYRGEMILMGVGVGEHYSSATWEDRGYRVRGSAALEVRAAARRALLRNGMHVDQLPPPLRAAQSGGEPAQGVGEEYVGRAIQLHNEAGFGPKESSVARAMLYNLAPPGSVIIVPDPLWVSETWAAMLAGAAARGCRVFVISPSLANGPNPQPAVAAIQHDVMLRLLDVSHRLRAQIAAAGGELRVGLYTARAEVTDLEGRRREIRQGLDRSPWIRGLIPFDSATLAVLNVATTRTEANGDVGTSLARDVRPRAPQLHQKTQLIARPGAIAALARQHGWDRVLASAMEVQSRQTQRFADQMQRTTPDVDSAAGRTADAMIRGYEQSLTPAERKAVSFYFTLGTQNQDDRGLMQDGEATIVVSGIHAALGLVDLYYIMARSTWIDSAAQLDALLPRPKGLQARLARLLRPVL